MTIKSYSYLAETLKAVKNQETLNMARFDLLLLLRWRIMQLNKSKD